LLTEWQTEFSLSVFCHVGATVVWGVDNNPVEGNGADNKPAEGNAEEVRDGNCRVDWGWVK